MSEIRGFEYTNGYSDRSAVLPYEPKDSADAGLILSSIKTEKYQLNSLTGLSSYMLHRDINRFYVKNLKPLNNKRVSKKTGEKYNKMLTMMLMRANLYTRPVMIRTGIKPIIPKGEVLKVYNVASNATKRGLLLEGGVRIIPPSCQEIVLPFINLNTNDLAVGKGEPIAQCFFEKVLPVNEMRDSDHAKQK